MISEDWTDEAARVSDLFVGILFKTLSQHLIAELSDARVSLPQIQAMRYIWLHQHVLIGNLAEGLMISYPSATNMVNRLEKQGLVERIINPTDRRQVEVKLTEQGVNLTSLMEEERVSRLREVLQKMKEEDRQSLLHGLTSFILAAVGDDKEAAEEICLRCGSKANNNCPVRYNNIIEHCK
jgi:DNA-binding MarR family transcriptional regulator